MKSNFIAGFTTVIPILFILIFVVGLLAATGEDLVSRGSKLFQDKGCVACHTIGKGKLVGPDLAGVTRIRDEAWLERWIMHPETMLFSDPIAKKLLKEFMVPMPNQGVTQDEVKAIIAYLKHNDAELNDKGDGGKAKKGEE